VCGVYGRWSGAAGKIKKQMQMNIYDKFHMLPIFKNKSFRKSLYCIKRKLSFNIFHVFFILSYVLWTVRDTFIPTLILLLMLHLAWKFFSKLSKFHQPMKSSFNIELVFIEWWGNMISTSLYSWMRKVIYQ
jgi:hypothetical protein